MRAGEAVSSSAITSGRAASVGVSVIFFPSRRLLEYFALVRSASLKRCAVKRAFAVEDEAGERRGAA
jgi:hypothetical protein